jgi:hypothetical protein
MALVAYGRQFEAICLTQVRKLCQQRLERQRTPAMLNRDPYFARDPRIELKTRRHYVQLRHEEYADMLLDKRNEIVQHGIPSIDAQLRDIKTDMKETSAKISELARDPDQRAQFREQERLKEDLEIEEAYVKEERKELEGVLENVLTEEVFAELKNMRFSEEAFVAAVGSHLLLWDLYTHVRKIRLLFKMDLREKNNTVEDQNRRAAWFHSMVLAISKTRNGVSGQPVFKTDPKTGSLYSFFYHSIEGQLTCCRFL